MTYWTVQDEHGDLDLIHDKRNRGTLNVSINMAEEITNALNILEFMREHLPETAKRVEAFYSDYRTAQLNIKNPPLATRGETVHDTPTT